MLTRNPTVAQMLLGWWSLSTDPAQGGASDWGYSFHDKPAEDVLRRFFGET